MSAHVIEIVVSPLPGKPGYWLASLEGGWVARSRTPFLDAARELRAQGWPDDTQIQMAHAGQPYAALRSTVGAAAGLTVRETMRDQPRIVPWRPFSMDGAVGEGSDA
jgi:hypothetical protein